MINTGGSRATATVSVVLCMVAASGLWWSTAEAHQRPGVKAVASAHPVATAAGHQILDAGGNAFDAAIAVTATLAVVEPYGSGLGGGGFWLLHREHDGHQVMIDGREKAPQAAHRDMYLDDDGAVVKHLSRVGPLAAGIPGTPAALAHLAERYGRLPLAQSLAPAIEAARDGFEVNEHYRRMAKFRLDTLGQDPETAAIFLADAQLPPVGYVIKQPDLARTLDAIAQRGADGFYRGDVARKLVAGVQAADGLWTEADLERYNVVERAPIVGDYLGIRVVAASPPSSGGIALVTMLNILAGYELEPLSDIDRTHLIIEAMRRAYRDRAEYLGDPDVVAIPTERLIHPYYAAGLRAGIRQDQATPSAGLPGVQATQAGEDTTHFSILDADGNRVAATLSINFPFGAAFTPPGTGVLLNNEMDDFSAKPGFANAYGLVGAEANAIAPGKRPLSSMTPTFLESDDGVAILGTPGGSRIITMVLLGALEFAAGKPPLDWVSRSRFHHQFLPDAVQFETDGLSAELQTGLAAKGHALKPLDRRYGNMQAVLWDRRRGEVSAASDPRGGGAAEVRRLPQTP